MWIELAVGGQSSVAGTSFLNLVPVLGSGAYQVPSGQKLYVARLSIARGAVGSSLSAAGATFGSTTASSGGTGFLGYHQTDPATTGEIELADGLLHEIPGGLYPALRMPQTAAAAFFACTLGGYVE